MLPKKSEYRIQYSKMNKDLRRQIWQDNIAVRKSRQLSNQATHYWEYQLRDENCDCEGEVEEDIDATLPPHRRKHNNLLKQYCHQTQPEKAQTGLPASFTPKDAREIAVQTPEWTEPDHRLNDPGQEELVKNISSLTIPESKGSQCRPCSISPSKMTQTSTKPRTARSLSRPSRTNLKLHSENKPSPFVPFGWNERKTAVGTKQTYNVTAPQREVHESAVQASQRRRADVERFLAQDKSAKKQALPNRSRERNIESVLIILPEMERSGEVPVVPAKELLYKHSYPIQEIQRQNTQYGPALSHCVVEILMPVLRVARTYFLSRFIESLLGQKPGDFFFQT